MAQVSAEMRNPLPSIGSSVRPVSQGEQRSERISADEGQSNALQQNPATIVNLSTAIQSSSSATAPKSFAAVATDARATMDAAYAAAGQKFGSSTMGSDWKTAFEGMDRRSMFAVASNEGGAFTGCFISHPLINATPSFYAIHS